MKFTVFAPARVATLGLVSLVMFSRVSAQRGEPSESSVLLKDARLSKPVSAPTGTTTTASVFSAIHRAADVRLYTEEAELKKAPLAVACDGQGAAPLMDAVSALWLARWEKDRKNNYKLLVSENELNIFLPKNEFRRERYAAGRRFISELNKLSPRDQAALRSGRRIEAGALPAALRQSLSAMVDAVNRESNDGSPFPTGRISESNLTFEVRNRGAFSSYSVSLGLPDWGSMGWAFNDYEERRRESGAVPGASGRTYNPIKFEVTQKQARELPALKKLVSIQAERATLPQILRALHEKYAIPFVSDPPRFMKQRASVNIRSLPLGEALDTLTETYKDTEWEWRKMGFLVVRGPTNPARDKKK